MLECQLDRVPDSVEIIVFGVIGGEPQDSVTLRFKPRLSPIVVIGLILKVVAGAIQLYDKPRRGTVEVDDVLTNGCLSAELPPV